MFRTILIALGALLLSASVQAATLSFVWDASPGATGYKMFCGGASRTYGAPVNVTPFGTSFSMAVSGGPTGAKVYCAVTALNAYGESGYSNEVVADVPADAAPAAPINLRVTVQVSYNPETNSVVGVITDVERLP